MRIRLTVPKEHVDEVTLGLGLEASTEVAQRQFESGEVPDVRDAIDQGQVVWAPEPADQNFEGFDLPKDVMARGWGDCDDLAPWLAACLRSTGEDPDAKAVVYQSGPKRWHAVVQTGDGDTLDPSRWAGMGKPGSPLPVTRPRSPRAQRGAAVSSVGFAPTKSGAVKARWDVPLFATKPGDIVGLALERSGDNVYDALARASNGALAVLAYWGAPDDVLLKMHAITHMLSGGDEESFERIHGCCYGDLGDFVGALAHRVGATAHMSVNPSDVANIAATIFDPLGIRNMVAPLAQSFVSNYASGLAQRGAPAPAVQPAPAASQDARAVGRDTRGRIHEALSTDEYDDTDGGGFEALKYDWKDGTFTPIVIGAASRSTSRGGSRGGSSQGSRGGSSRGGQGQNDSSRRSQASSSQSQPYDDGYGGYGPANYFDPNYEPDDAAWAAWANAAAPWTIPGAAQGYGGYAPSPYTPGQYMQPQFYPQPQGAMMPMQAPGVPGAPAPTDLVLDPYGGYATPTAFSQYWKTWIDEQPRSAFDGTVMTGDLGQDFVEADDLCPPPYYHWVKRGGISVCEPDAGF